MGGTDSGRADLSGMMGMFSNRSVETLLPFCTFTKSHWIVCLQGVNFMVYNLYLNKVVLKRKGIWDIISAVRAPCMASSPNRSRREVEIIFRVSVIFTKASAGAVRCSGSLPGG